MGVGIYNRGSFQNHSNSSLHGQLTNEIQNGVSIARSYDSLARPTGHALNPVHPVILSKLTTPTMPLAASPLSSPSRRDPPPGE